ncbi:hypothetical protein C8J57DRAFT_1301650, partial [Mycena rebaudengoi]
MGIVSRRVNVSFIIDIPSRACVSLSSAWSACPASSCAVCPVFLFASPSAARRHASTFRSSALHDSAAHRASVSTPRHYPRAAQSVLERLRSPPCSLRDQPRPPFRLPPRPGSPAEPSAGTAYPRNPQLPLHTYRQAPKRACFRLRLRLVLLLRIITILLLLASSIATLLLPAPGILLVPSTTTA